MVVDVPFGLARPSATVGEVHPCAEAGMSSKPMSDLVKRLRDHENEGGTTSDRFHQREEAADRIERLETALRELLRTAEAMRHGGYRDSLVQAYDGWAHACRAVLAERNDSHA